MINVVLKAQVVELDLEETNNDSAMF